MSYKTRHFIQLTSRQTFCLTYLSSMRLLHNKMISILIAEVPKKFSIPAGEWAVVLITRWTNIFKHYYKKSNEWNNSLIFVIWCTFCSSGGSTSGGVSFRRNDRNSKQHGIFLIPLPYSTELNKRRMRRIDWENRPVKRLKLLKKKR